MKKRIKEVIALTIGSLIGQLFCYCLGITSFYDVLGRTTFFS